MLWPAPRAHFGRVHTGVQPERDPGVPEIVGPLGQPRGEFRAGQDVLPCPRPRRAIRSCVHVVAGLVPEQSAVRRHAEPFDVCTEDAYELRRDGHRPGRGSRAALERVLHRAVVRPLLSCGDDTARQVEHPPPGVGQVALVEPEVNDLRRPHGRVVHAAEERLQVRTAPALLANRREQPDDLGRIGNGQPGPLPR